MARARRKTAKKPARKTRTRRYPLEPYKLGIEAWHTAWLAGEADTRAEFRAWIREHGTEKMYRLFSGKTEESKDFRAGVVEGRKSITEVGMGLRRGEIHNPRRRRNYSGSFYAWKKEVKKKVKAKGGHIGDAFLEHLYVQGLSPTEASRQWMSNPRRRKNFFGGGKYIVDAQNPFDKRHSKEKRVGTKREADYYKEYYEDMGYDVTIRTANPRRRNVSRALLREAREAGVPESVTRRIARRKPKSWEDAPMSVKEMKRTESGTKYWDITTGYNSKYRYYLKKLSDGWVAEFRKMGKKGGAAPLRYINHQGTAKTHHTYFRTQGEAFRALVQHIMGGKHLPYRNPRRRR